MYCKELPGFCQFHKATMEPLPFFSFSNPVSKKLVKHCSASKSEREITFDRPRVAQ